MTAVLAASPVEAGSPPSITGGGATSDMARFALGINNGEGHFECLMPSLMTVEATVTGIDSMTSQTATFHGRAQVTLGGNNPFGMRSGPMARDVPFTATVRAGGPGKGFVDLTIMGMDFAGVVTHGQVTIST